MKKLNTQSIIIGLLLVIIGLLGFIVWKVTQSEHECTNCMAGSIHIDSSHIQQDIKPTQIAELKVENSEKKTTPKPPSPASKKVEEKPTEKKADVPKPIQTSNVPQNDNRSISERLITPIDSPELPKPVPEVDPTELFGDPNNYVGNNGNNSGNGSITVHTPPAEEGQGSIGSRPMIKKGNLSQDATFDEEGIAWVMICVNANGDVTSAEFVTRTARGEVSTITQRNQKRLAEECAKQSKYAAVEGASTSCGTIPISFSFQ